MLFCMHMANTRTEQGSLRTVVELRTTTAQLHTFYLKIKEKNLEKIEKGSSVFLSTTNLVKVDAVQ